MLVLVVSRTSDRSGRDGIILKHTGTVHNLNLTM
jgi:hypothetical protein